VQDSDVSGPRSGGALPWPGSLAGRLAILLAGFIVVATLAVAAREYRAGEEQLVAESYRALQFRAGFASDRLADALAERQRIAALWAELETSQDLAVDDVDKRISSSLADLARMLGPGSEAVAAHAHPGVGEVVLAASDPARLESAGPPLPQAVDSALTSPTAGLTLEDGGNALVVATADVISRVDESILGRIAVWTPLGRFLSTALPLELGSVQLTDGAGQVLYRGADLTGSDDDYLWARDTANTVGGPFGVAVARPRAEVTADLRRTGRQLITLALLFLLLAVPAALLVVRSATRGLGRLTRAARELDPHDPAPLPRVSRWAPDEVRVLGDAMAAMVDRLERASEELAKSESLAAIGVLTKSLAHEIRTPLSVLRAGTEMLLRSPAAGPREREVSEMLQAEVERLSRLVDDLLIFGRPSPPVMGDMDLRRVADDALYALEATASEKSVDLALEGAEARMRGDADQLRQVVVNLVSNGVRACPEGGRVLVTTAVEDGFVVLDVEDNGEGIPSDRLDEIWKPLVTTHRSGTGLGLPIVRQLVEAHGGHVEVRSTPGEGTRMRVVLPADATQERS
jgi:signal transduction histidine kinase